LCDALPPLADLIPTECLIGWDVTLTGDITREAIEDVFIFVMDDMDMELTPLASVAIESAAGQRRSPSLAAACPQRPSWRRPLPTQPRARRRGPGKACGFRPNGSTC
jgi:hypothetical protein